MTSLVSLAHFAIESLHSAATVQPDDAVRITEARGVWQPDSWLIHRCWQVLAEAGAANDALTIASMAEMRHPLAPFHALYTLAKQADSNPQLPQLVSHELVQMSARLFSPWVASEQTQQIERLLYASASASCIGDSSFAFACLERLDQFPRAWDRVIVHPEMRVVLADTITRVGLHPLTCYLMDTAIRDFQDAGAQFIQQIATTIQTRRSDRQQNARYASPNTSQLKTDIESGIIYGDELDVLMARCVKACRNTILTSIHSRRIAATVLAQAGLIDETLEQVHTIATIQDAHRETGSARASRSTTTSQYAGTEFRAGQSDFNRRGRISGDSDGQILRQVERSRSDSDVDFLVHTIKSAIDVFPLDHATPQQRANVGKQVAALGALSDGWTAAGAAATLIKLGGVQDAIDVVEQVQDATHSEGAIEVVSGLLETGQDQFADMQAQAALTWARDRNERTPERAIIWGIADAYLDNDRADRAIQILAVLDDVPNQRNAFSRFFRGEWSADDSFTDEDLRSGKLRLRAFLQKEMQHADLNGAASSEATVETAAGFDAQISPQTDALIRELCGWAPQLLEGEALINFYLDGILEPLLAAGKSRYAWGLLPQLRDALLAVRGSKHAARVAQITKPLADRLDAYAAQNDPAHTAAMRRRLEEFSVLLWQENARRGIWQAVYGIDGSLPMLLALEGPDALVEIANAAANEGALWSRVDES